LFLRDARRSSPRYCTRPRARRRDAISPILLYAIWATWTLSELQHWTRTVLSGAGPDRRNGGWASLLLSFGDCPRPTGAVRGDAWLATGAHSKRRVRCAQAEQGLCLINVTLSSRTDSRCDLFLYAQHLSPAGTPDPRGAPDGAAFGTSCGANYAPIPRRRHGGPSRSSSCGVELTPEDAHYSTRLSLLERHVSQAVRHLLPASQSASRHKRRGPCGNGVLGTSDPR
jgi:hypothetical protein